MATGDQNDMSSRFIGLLPPWFSSGAEPVLTAIAQGWAYALSFCYGLIQFAKLQTRIATATDGFLDIIAYDFYGGSLLRDVGQSDASFSLRIREGFFQAQTTRASLITLLSEVTGNAATIKEAWRPGDVGGWNYGALGYNTGAGCYGSLALNAQIFVTIAPGTASDASIEGALANNVAAGVVAWVDIT